MVLAGAAANGFWVVFWLMALPILVGVAILVACGGWIGLKKMFGRDDD